MSETDSHIDESLASERSAMKSFSKSENPALLSLIVDMPTIPRELSHGSLDP